MTGAIKLASSSRQPCEREGCEERATHLIVTNNEKSCLCPAHIDELMLEMVLGR